MELPVHVAPSTRSRFARWIPSVRAVALLTLGVGIGVVASLPLGGTTALPVVVAVVAASAAAFLAVLYPEKVGAIAASDVLLGIAVMASVFGHLGVLYVPLVLGFFAVTARAEQPGRHAAEASLRWRPAPEFDRMRPSLAAPTVREPEHVWLPDSEPQVVRAARGTLEPLGEAWLAADTAERPTWLSGASMVAGIDDHPPIGRVRLGPAAFAHPVIRAPRRPDLHRVGPAAVARVRLAPPMLTHRVGPAAVAAMQRPEPTVVAEPTTVAVAAVAAAVVPSDGRVRRLRVLASKERVVSAAVRARRAVRIHARVGFENLLAALSDEPQINLVVPPRPASDAPPSAAQAERRLVVLPDSELVELRRALGEHVADVGAGRLTLVDADARPASPAPVRHLQTKRVARHHIGA